MQEKKTERAPGGYEDFVAYLGTVRTEEELFSPLTYWFVGQNCPEDVCFRPQLVEARAKELGFWQGLTFKVEHWMTTSRAEAEAAGREAFQSRIGEDYAAYREKAEAARERARRRRLSSPFLYIPKCLDDIPVRDVSWLVEGLLPQGEVSLLGADGGTGKGIWQAQLVAYVTAGKTSGFFPQPPGQTGRVLIFAGEDDPSKVLKARLMAAGADMSRVMVQTSDAYFSRTGNPLCIPDKSFAKYIESAAPAQAILDVLAEAKLGSMPNTQLRAEVVRETGCSDRTYERAYGTLIKSGEVVKKNLRQQDGQNQWYSFLHCGGTSGEVPINKTIHH